MTDLFYFELEEGVREFVRTLRNAGINTECSCHHDGYIQCQSLDPTTEIDRIRRAFGSDFEYVVEVHFEQQKGDPAYWHQYLMITSQEFKKEI